jgi:hypothetical protein
MDFGTRAPARQAEPNFGLDKADQTAICEPFAATNDRKTGKTGECDAISIIFGHNPVVV